MIDLDEFKQMLVESGVRMTTSSKSSGLGLKKKTTMFEEEEQQTDQDQLRINELVIKLREKIEAHKVDLFTVYDSYDKNKDESLSFEEFTKLLAKIDSTLTPAEQSLCFNRFDINGDKKISFDEFYRTICKIAGEPASYSRKRAKG